MQERHKTEIIKFFKPELLTFLRENRNNKVRKILENYESSDFLTTIYNMRDSFQSTILHYAAKYGNEEIVKHLIDSGSKVDAQDCYGRTPLVLAVAQKHEKVVEILLEAKADFNVTISEDKNALQMIVRMKSIDYKMIKKLFGNMTIDKIIEHDLPKKLYVANFRLSLIAASGNVELIKLLLDQGYCKVDDKDYENGQTALHVAFETQDIEMIKFLIGYGANIDAVDNEGNTMVHYLAHNHGGNVDGFLQEQNFNVNVRNKVGDTPLHLASENLMSHVVNFLLQSGADIRIRDFSDNNPLQRLFQKLNVDSNFNEAKKCIQLLLEYGSEILDNYFFNLWHVNFHLLLISAEKEKMEDFSKLLQPLVAYLVIHETFGIEISSSALSEVNQEYIHMCREQVDQMNKTKIYGNVTLFKFLTANKRKITAYVRNEELLSELEKIIEKFELDSPYPELLRIRLARAILLAKLKEKAISIIIRLINLQNYASYFIAENIVDYLSIYDMKNVNYIMKSNSEEAKKRLRNKFI